MLVCGDGNQLAWNAYWLHNTPHVVSSVVQTFIPDCASANIFSKRFTSWQTWLFRLYCPILFHDRFFHLPYTCDSLPLASCQFRVAQDRLWLPVNPVATIYQDEQLQETLHTCHWNFIVKPGYFSPIFLLPYFIDFTWIYSCHDWDHSPDIHSKRFLSKRPIPVKSLVKSYTLSCLQKDERRQSTASTSMNSLLVKRFKKLRSVHACKVDEPSTVHLNPNKAFKGPTSD